MRRSAAQLHALEKVEREIRATDPHPRRKYLRDFTEAYKRYSEILTPDLFLAELRRADILLVGDYHALPRCQQFTAELVEQLRAEGRPTVLGLEMIFSRDQPILDQWQLDRLEDEELRQRIRHDLEWGYDWEPTRDLLVRARTAGAQIRGLDCLPRGDLRRIGSRDRHAATEIAEIRSKSPDATIVTLFGESHLAPQHLPKLVRAAIPEARVLTVLQNVDALYWQASGEPGDAVRAVRVDADTVCVFNATPLEKYERYRLCIERWRQDRPGSPDVAPTFYNLVQALLRFFDMEDSRPDGARSPEFLPAIVAVENDVDLSAALSQAPHAAPTAGPPTHPGFSEDELVGIRDRLARSGCCYVPGPNLLLVHRFDISSAAEEAARFTCCVGWGDTGLPSPSTSGERAFYIECLRHALVEYGSHVLCPGRESLHEHDLYALYSRDREDMERASSFNYAEYMGMLDFVLLHRDFECNARFYRSVPELIHEGRGYSAAKFAQVTCWLGRLLGSDLYEAYLRGSVTKRSIRSLFLGHTEQPKAAYFRLANMSRRQRRLLS